MEREPSYDYERERRTEMEASIEGRVERSFTEIDISQAQPIPLHDITWLNAALTFGEIGRYSVPSGQFGMDVPVRLYAAQLEYIDKNGGKRKGDLTATTPKGKPVLFSGDSNGFYAHDPLMRGKADPFYVVGIQPEELAKNMNRLSAVYHELGHVLIFHKDADTQLLRAALTLQAKYLPEVSLAAKYASELAGLIPDSVRGQNLHPTRNTLSRLEARLYSVGRIVSLFHERNAWAAGANLFRGNNYPTGFQEQRSYFKYAKLCLSSYARHYKDKRFVTGLR